MKTLISILMPVKNASPFLKDTLSSILNQSINNWELIAVNDHSSDDGPSILNSFANSDQRIKVFKNNGMGIIDALQTAYEYASGELIHRMDADDLMPEDKLEILSKLLHKSGKGYVATAMVKYFSEESLKEGYQKYAEWLNSLCINNTHWKEIYKECVVASPNWLIHKTDLEKCRAFHHQQYPEDYDLVFRFYEQGMQITSANQLTHYWRDHHERSSRNLPQYKDNDFFELKWQYYQKLENDVKRPLMVWGAGKKGKKLAKILNKNKVDFEWVSNNPNKHGKEIYHQILKSFREILQKKNPQIIIAVGQIGAKKQITDFLVANKMEEGKDFTFFC